MSTYPTLTDRLEAILDQEPHPLSVQFYDALVGCAELHAAKQADYGRDNDPFANVRASQEFGIAPWLGAVMRLNDKVSRLKSFAQKGTLKNEGVEDSLRDIAVYALIALILFREKPTVSPSSTIAAMHTAVMDSMTEAVKAACVAKEPNEMQRLRDRLEMAVAQPPGSNYID